MYFEGGLDQSRIDDVNFDELYKNYEYPIYSFIEEYTPDFYQII